MACLSETAPILKLAGVLAALVALPWVARAEALIELRLSTPPHAPEGAPDAIVHVPTRIAPERPLHVVVFLHGFSSCARQLVASTKSTCLPGGAPQRPYQLAKIHEGARGNTLLIVPQLAFLARDARAPRFEAHGGFDAFLRDVRARLAPQLDPNVGLASVTLIAHSAGYRAASAILSDPSLTAPVMNVVLFDALYAHWDVFAGFLRDKEGRRLISLYTRDRSTTRGNRMLASQLGCDGKRRGRAPETARGLRQERVATPHGLIPTRHLGEILHELFDQKAP